MINAKLPDAAVLRLTFFELGPFGVTAENSIFHFFVLNDG